MKKLLVFWLILFFCVPALFGQELLLGILPAIEGKIIYSGEEKVPGAGVENLHKKALGWFDATNKVSSDSIVSDTSDEIRGTGKYKIRAKGVGVVGYDMEVMYKITLKFNEGGYSYIFTDFKGRTEGKFGPIEDPMENWNSEFTEKEKRDKKNTKVYPQVNEGMVTILDGLQKTLATAN